MANIKFTIECDECSKEYSIEKMFDARNNFKNFTPFKKVFDDAVNQGWHLGFRTLCPKCVKIKRNTCETCVFYHNNTMESPYCNCDEFDVQPIVKENDFCCNWKTKTK